MSADERFNSGENNCDIWATAPRFFSLSAFGGEGRGEVANSKTLVKPAFSGQKIRVYPCPSVVEKRG
jgi:hypothetical protein